MAKVDRKELLKLIKDNPGIHTKDLANKLKVSVPTIVYNVNKLRESGARIDSGRKGYFFKSEGAAPARKTRRRATRRRARRGRPRGRQATRKTGAKASQTQQVHAALQALKKGINNALKELS